MACVSRFGDLMVYMDIGYHFSEKIHSVIKADPSLVAVLTISYPNFYERLVSNSYSVAELESIHASIANFEPSASAIRNIIIALRLGGGLAESAIKMSMSSDELLNYMQQLPRNLELLQSKLLASNIINNASFFTKHRQFFNESQIRRYRRDNITNLLVTAPDSESYISAISTLRNILSPHSDVLVSLQSGQSHPKADWACRLIESKLEIGLGMLDAPSTNY